MAFLHSGRATPAEIGLSAFVKHRTVTGAITHVAPSVVQSNLEFETCVKIEKDEIGAFTGRQNALRDIRINDALRLAVLGQSIHFGSIS